MTGDQFSQLSIGDIIRHANSTHSCVVTGCYGDRVTAVRSFDVTNPAEWDLVIKMAPKKPDSWYVRCSHDLKNWGRNWGPFDSRDEAEKFAVPNEGWDDITIEFGVPCCGFDNPVKEA